MCKVVGVIYLLVLIFCFCYAREVGALVVHGDGARGSAAAARTNGRRGIRHVVAMVCCGGKMFFLKV